MTDHNDLKRSVPANPILAPDHERALNDKIMELQALFEMSQILNSSLNLKSILDNMLLTPMGKMMISKGIILLNQNHDIYVVETLKGLPRTLIGKQIPIDITFINPTFIDEIDANKNNWVHFFKQLGMVVLLPISSHKKNLGIISFGGKIAGNEYRQAELDFLNSLSNIAATSIENGLIFQELNNLNKRLDRKIQELNTLFEIGKELNSTLDVNKVLNLLLYAIMGEMLVNRCAILLRKTNKMELRISKGIGPTDQEIRSQLTKAIQKNLCDLDVPIILDNVTTNQQALTALKEINFEVLIPMRIQDETPGVIMIGPKIIKQAFREDELEFLFTLGNLAMISIENARLFEDALEKQRLEEELAIAQEIQQRLLPKKLPQLEHIQISAVNIPSRQVGGDYYDCFPVNSSQYALAIADVSGKGTPASLLMANVQASLHALVETHLPLDLMLQKINNLTYENTSADKFITFFYCLLDKDNLTLTYSNAGHNPPYLFHQNGEFELLSTGGLLLGMLPNVVYQVSTVSLHSGDWLIFYTDGVNEAINKNEEEFDNWRLEQVINSNRDKSAEEMLNAIIQAIRDFVIDVPQSDDITLIIVKIC